MKNKKAYNTVQILIFFNLLLALVAFIKDVFLASYFGTSNIADSINLAFFLPDTIGNNLIGAGIAVSSIPIFSKLSVGDDFSIYKNAVQKLVTSVFISTIIVWMLSIFLTIPLFQLFHIKTGEHLTIIKQYYYLLAPIIIFAPIWLLGSSILQASKRFIIPAVTPIFHNVFLLFSLLIFQLMNVPQTIGGKYFSISITLATFFVGIITWWVLRKQQSFKFTMKDIFKKCDSSEIRKISSTFLPYLFILMFGQTALLFERFFASSLETGTIAALSYAYRISQFPLWVFIAAINTFILPTISIHVAKKDFHSLKRDLTISFLFVILISSILSLLLVLFSEPLLKIVLARGSFDLHSVKLTSTILKGYGLSIVGQSLYVFCTRYYVAEGKMKVPFFIGLVGSIVNIVLLNYLVPIEGAIGIGHAVAISSTLNGALILIYFIKNLFVTEIRGGVSYE